MMTVLGLPVVILQALLDVAQEVQVREDPDAQLSAAQVPEQVVP